MSGIKPYLGTLRNIWSRTSSMVCAFLLHILTPSYSHPEMFMNLLHRCLNIIGTQTLLIPFLCRFSRKCHPGIRTLNRIEWSTRSCLQYSIICGKLCQLKPLNPFIMLMVYKHPEILLDTSVHLFCLSIRLWMKGCQHSLVNPQSTTHLLPES